VGTEFVAVLIASGEARFSAARAAGFLNRAGDCGGRGHGRFATGTDEGVRPYTCAWLRLRWTGESARPHPGRA